MSRADQRTDTEIILDAPIATVTLCGAPVEIREARIADDLAFRRQADRLAGVVVGAITAATMKVAGGAAPEERQDKAKLQSILAANQAEFAAQIIPAVLGEGMAVAVNMLFAYAPYLDRERIEREATSDELEEAALTVIELALPFIRARMTRAMRMMRILEGMQ